jgi:hypothetical protein
MRAAPFLLAASVALATSGLAGVARADEPASDDVVHRYPPSDVRWKLVGGGVAFTGLMWGASYLSASQWPDASPGIGALKVPVAGPWISLFQNQCPASDPNCGAILYLRAILEIVDGLAQAGGLAVAAEGLLLTTESPKATRRPAATVRAVPIVTGTTTGAGIVGTF